MHDARLAEFSRERLDGRPIPDDLRVLLIAQWEGRTELGNLLDLDFLKEGELGPLLDTSHMTEAMLADPETQANNAGLAKLTKHLKLVANARKGWAGYWLNPDDPESRWRPVVLDTECTFWALSGETLSDGAAAEQAHYEDEPDIRDAYARLATELAALGLPLSTRDYDALDHSGLGVDPEEFLDDLVDAEREKLGIL
ncbi:hypothetical protein ACWIGI_06365 [Nocardia sp. NPDC055321]